jgi:hypothetical protein
MKVVRLIKMRLHETYSKIRICKYLFDNFPIKNGLKQEDALSPLRFNFTLEYAIRKIQETKYMLLSRHQNAEQNHDIKICNTAFENVASSNIWERQ